MPSWPSENSSILSVIVNMTGRASTDLVPRQDGVANVGPRTGRRGRINSIPKGSVVRVTAVADGKILVTTVTPGPEPSKSSEPSRRRRPRRSRSAALRLVLADLRVTFVGFDGRHNDRLPAGDVFLREPRSTIRARRARPLCRWIFIARARAPGLADQRVSGEIALGDDFVVVF